MLSSEYVYKDRKMMKWMPFQALLEQGDYVSDLLIGKSRKQMPVLSSDQQDDLNYRLETAQVFDQELMITYYSNYEYYTVTGNITKIDLYTKTIHLDEKVVNAQTIISINII